MKNLTKPAYQKAVAYLQNEARPLERARYAHHFENGSATDILAQLATFQNSDGGFGHGLEPDLQLTDSSVIATTVAFQRLRDLALPGDHSVVAKACRYLLDTFDTSRVNWPIMPSNVDDAPHAPWWTPNGDLSRSMSNPRAEIAGYLSAYPEHFPAAMREPVISAVTNYLFEQPDTMEMHDLLCYIRFWEAASLSPDSQSRILEKLKRIVENIVERNPEGWKSYGLQPLAIASRPSSPFAESFRTEIEQNLDFLIEGQGEEGAWMPNWSWGENWPADWAQARRQWAGIITLENLLTLDAYGRIDS